MKKILNNFVKIFKPLFEVDSRSLGIFRICLGLLCLIDITRRWNFIDIFNSDRYWRAMNYIASPAFDSKSHMGALSIVHYVSTALDNHVKGIKKITPPTSSEKPLHVNFL